MRPRTRSSSPDRPVEEPPVEDCPVAVVVGGTVGPALMLTLTVSLLFAASAKAQQTTLPASTHVHGLDQPSRDLLALAARRSPTVFRLLARLDASDVIVGVQAVIFTVPGTGDLTWLGGAGGWRHLRVRLERRASLEDRIAWLGHELFHAVEVADHAEVCDGAALKTFYRRAGRTIGEGHYETTAATRVTAVVHGELTGASRTAPTTAPLAVVAADAPPRPVTPDGHDQRAHLSDRSELSQANAVSTRGDRWSELPALLACVRGW